VSVPNFYYKGVVAHRNYRIGIQYDNDKLIWNVMVPIIVKADTRSAIIFWVLFGGIAVILVFGPLFGEGPISRYGPLPYMGGGFIVLAGWMHAWLKMQTLTLSDDGVLFTKLTIFGLKKKYFPMDSIEGWYYFHAPGKYGAIGIKSLVIKSNKGPRPKLPHGPFANMDGVMIIPPVFRKRYSEIEKFFNSNMFNV
jgi:hypothetical protein